MSQEPGQTLIDLIRHGEPEGGSMYRGHSIDDPLSEKGWQQMRSATNGDVPWQHIISSPLIRCQAFAQELADKHDIPLSIEHDLREVGFGSWEGKTRQQIKNDNIQEYEDFYRDPVNCRPPEAEPLDGFISRVTCAYQVQRKQHSGKHILIVAHAGVIRAIVADTLHTEPLGLYRITVDNAGISRIRVKNDVGYLEALNSRLENL